MDIIERTQEVNKVTFAIQSLGSVCLLRYETAEEKEVLKVIEGVIKVLNSAEKILKEQRG